jgi:hypothetical protein
MAGRTHSLLARAAAVGILAAWVPCPPLGLCARSAVGATKATSHHCHRQPALRIAAAPPACSVPSTTPMPPAPAPPALDVPAAVAMPARPLAAIAVPSPPPTTFSPLAIVLRI